MLPTPIEAIGKSVDHKTLAAALETDEKLRDIVNSDTSALQLKKIRFPDYDAEIYCDVSGDIVRPYVLKSLRRDVFNALHGLSHPGIRDSKTCKIAFCLACVKQRLPNMDTAMRPVSAM